MLKIQILHLEFDFVALMSVGRLAALTLSQLFSSPHSLYVTQCPHWNLKSVSNLSSWNSVPNSFEKPPWSYIGLGGKSFHRSKMGCLSFGAFEVSVELSLGKKKSYKQFLCTTELADLESLWNWILLRSGTNSTMFQWECGTGQLTSHLDPWIVELCIKFFVQIRKTAV